MEDHGSDRTQKPYDKGIGQEIGIAVSVLFNEKKKKKNRKYRTYYSHMKVGDVPKEAALVTSLERGDLVRVSQFGGLGQGADHRHALT